ncbi:MAG: MBL fold metallo-hydrolase [Candidatus Micrarchaeia archaeon]
MRLTFNGAAGMVTGSCYLLEAAGKKILVDCGMFQGPKEIVRLNYEPFRFDPREIDFVLLTHTHIDHCGLIPKLAKEGFGGRVLATPPTLDLARIMLEDCAEVNAEDTREENRRRMREGLEPREPIYKMEDVKRALRLFTPIEYNRERHLSSGIKVCYRDAGHILGSAIIEVFVNEQGRNVKIVFSGDLGQGNTPIVDDPTMIDSADYVLIESTYGDREHQDPGTRESELSRVVRSAFSRGGKLLIPSFSVERTQELLYYIHRLIAHKKFPKEEVFLDSPLSIKATALFHKNRRYCRQSLKDEFKEPFLFSQLKCLKTPEESMTMNNYRRPSIIIAGNGMCTSGRIRHHLKHNLWKKETTICFVGYQAEGTLGRIIEEGAQRVKMMGMEVVVRAHVEKIDGFSSHADSQDLERWLDGFKRRPKKVFIVHGERSSAEGLGRTLRGKGYRTHIPRLGESVTL